MIYLIENKHMEKDYISKIIPEKLLTPVGSNKLKCEYIGYFKEKGKEPVVILPKIFESLDIENESIKGFLNQYSISQYLTLKKYKNVYKINGKLPEDILSVEEITYIDVSLALRKFYENNKHLKQIVIVKRSEKHIKNINWTAQLNKGKFTIVNDDIIFDNYLNKNNTLCNEDFLLKLLYREIVNINQKLRLGNIDKDLPVLNTREYNKFMKKPVRNLKLLKKIYFRDEFRKLINLLINYYTVLLGLAGKNSEEFLLTNNFQNIFETLVDSFISDKDLLSKYKNHKDGKILDHIYEYKSIITDDKTLYIGDSKYYKDLEKIKHTKWKQFTYVKNIQDILIEERNSGNTNKYIEYLLDDIFHSYNIIPNFFLSPFIDLYRSTKNIYFQEASHLDVIHKYHIPNKLFDRDTLNIFYFEIDLLFLMEGYIYGFDLKIKEQFKEEIYRCIKNFYFNRYSFYTIDFDEKVLEIIKSNYYLLYGKVFALNNKKVIIVALSESDKSSVNKEIIDLFSKKGITINKIAN